VRVAYGRLEQARREQGDGEQQDERQIRQDPANQAGEQDAVPERVAIDQRCRRRGLLACCRQNKPPHNMNIARNRAQGKTRNSPY
jgi:hypothetical protein